MKIVKTMLLVSVLIGCSGCANITSSHYVTRDEAIKQNNGNQPTFQVTRANMLHYLDADKNLTKPKQKSYTTLTYKSKDHFFIYVDIEPKSDKIHDVRLTSDSDSNYKQMIAQELIFAKKLNIDMPAFQKWLDGQSTKTGYQRYEEKHVEIGISIDPNKINIVTQPKGGII